MTPCVISPTGVLQGIITDNDVRRGIQRSGADLLSCTAQDVMNSDPAVVVHQDQLAYEALRHMEDRDRPVSVAPVVDDARVCLGMLRVHDLLRAGL